jgi:hypothetical protein
MASPVSVCAFTITFWRGQGCKFILAIFYGHGQRTAVQELILVAGESPAFCTMPEAGVPESVSFNQVPGL